MTTLLNRVDEVTSRIGASRGALSFASMPKDMKHPVKL